MKNTFIRSALIVFLFSGIIFAEEPEKPLSRQLGLSFSSGSGAGLYYQFFLSEDYRMKLNGLVFYNYSNSDDMYLYANGGLEFQKTIHSTKYTRLYGLAGGAYWYEKGRSPEYDDPDDDERVTGIDKVMNKRFTTGLGLGIEFLILSHVAINIDLCYYYEQYLSKEYRSIGFGGGGGIGYAF